ncbi:M3 family oligoendopeptidase [Limibaculum sp. M0105]|uniref:M3 family oligoendopeptidase n=1 Tax=Thermohalobaculum xanthum TaxID=2753746 RepID=A0A8J7SE39_9RHOB|nr:M3 family oligoendopeptidase [Thermohalobaculum xanthum]MBK0399256.1 M3 family oligoendopeptidase [Thermohalobaculum xanthum]
MPNLHDLAFAFPATSHIRPLRDTAAERGGAVDLGELPEWDLSDLYAAPAAPELAADLDRVEAECRDFAARFEGRIASLGAEEVADAIAAFEAIDLTLGRVMSYAGLRYYQNTTDPARAKFMGDTQTRVTAITTPLVFFTLELNRLEETHVEALMAESARLARYRPWLDRLRAFRPHQLSDELEKFLHDQSVVGASAWNRLFDETMAGLSFEVEGEDEPLGLEGTLNLLSDKDRARREAGGKALAGVLADNIRLFALITNTLTKEKEIEDRWRKMPAPDHSRHLANHVEPEVVDALREAVWKSFPRTSHRYYAMKAKWLGLEQLEYWDRNAPLPESDDRVVPWPDAREIVLDAYAGFSPKMAELAEPFFERGWIDAGVKPGKAPGAFAHPTVVDVHPYVMLNYLGKTRDVMTLAHELGHGVHQRLAAGQGELLSRTPLTLAETASVFGEMLTFRKLLAAESDPARRKMLLAGKVEDMLNTVIRQIAFYEFERRVHAARREGELTAEDLAAHWLAVQSESLGPSINLADGYETFWAYIPHFIHSPFYVYAYAFGDGLVNALYAVYEQGVPGFQDKYFEMLAAGGAKHHKELLAPFGLDASDPAFWQKGLGLIGRFIDELEAMG